MSKLAAWRIAPVWFGLALAIGTRASAQSRPADGASVAPTDLVTLNGSVTDARNLPVVGAVITARGSAVGWTATRPGGTYVLSVPPGSYDILVRKGGYSPGTASVLVGPGSTRSLSFSLAEANLASVSVGSTRSKSGINFNTGVSATATLSDAAMSERPELTAQQLALELPGVTLAHGSDSAPDTSFVVRGGTIETRVQIDGHAVSAGATGRWDSSDASLPLFDSIELVKGAGISGANAGESAFGTINLQTRDFTRGRQADLVSGRDGFGGSFSTFAISGTLLSSDRLSYVFEHNLYGYNGPYAGKVVNNVAPEPNGTALLVDRTSLSSPLMLGSDLAKVRWRFNGTTSVTLGYVGIHGDYADSEAPYGTYLGQRTIVPFATGGDGGNEYSSPKYPGLIGKSVPAYNFGHNTPVYTNQPLFEGELRTAIKNDTLLIRPYASTIFNLLDGAGRADGPDPGNGNAWTPITTGNGCSTQQPCLVPDTSYAAFQAQEIDRLHGITFTLIHPMGDGSLNVSYDYRSDQTTVASGDPNVPFNGTSTSEIGYFPSIPSTLARNYDSSATYTVPLTPRVGFFVGDYFTNWKLRYGEIGNDVNFATGAAVHSLRFGNRAYEHSDPHTGLTWHPGTNTTYRFSAGSAVTVPYAELVSGGQSFFGPLSGTGVVSEKNPNLQPESTVAYNLGIDQRLRNGAVVSADAFDNTIHNVFATQVSPFNGAAFGVPAGSPLNAVFATTVIPLNAPLERNYGIEAALTHAPVTGLGYHVAATLQRAFLDQLPASFFMARSSLVNGKQLDGSTSIPYTHAYAEINFRLRSGLAGSLGTDYTGTNNWTNGPAFMVWSSMLRYDSRGGYRAQFSIENLFDHSTGTQSASGVANAGFGQINYGAESAGGIAAYGTTPTTRYAIAPRTYRFEVQVHVGH